MKFKTPRVALSLLFEASSCGDCPFHKIIPDSDPQEREELLLAVVCTRSPNDTRACGPRSTLAEQSPHRTVASNCRKQAPSPEVPAWCPLREENQTLTDLDIERLWTRPRDFLDPVLHKLGISRRRFNQSLPTNLEQGTPMFKEHVRLIAELLEEAFSKRWTPAEMRTWLLEPHPILGCAPIDRIPGRIAEVRTLLQESNIRA